LVGGARLRNLRQAIEDCLDLSADEALLGARVTLKEAAALLGVTPDNLRQAIARGALKAVKHGRDWWVSAAEVERYRTQNRRVRS
jgi:excisionase family DNA binding protein